MKSDYYVDVVKFQKAMIDAGLKTTVALATASGVSRRTIAGLMAGNVKPNLSVVYSLARALKLSSYQAGEIFFAKIVA